MERKVHLICLKLLLCLDRRLPLAFHLNFLRLRNGNDSKRHALFLKVVFCQMKFIQKHWFSCENLCKSDAPLEYLNKIHSRSRFTQTSIFYYFGANEMIFHFRIVSVSMRLHVDFISLTHRSNSNPRPWRNCHNNQFDIIKRNIQHKYAFVYFYFINTKSKAKLTNWSLRWKIIQRFHFWHKRPIPIQNSSSNKSHFRESS